MRSGISPELDAPLTLFATAKVNDAEPFAYLKATLEAIAAGHPKSRIDELLPWNFKPAS